MSILPEPGQQRPVDWCEVFCQVFAAAMEHLGPAAAARAAVETLLRLTGWPVVSLFLADEAGTCLVGQVAVCRGAAGGVADVVVPEGTAERAFSTAETQYCADVGTAVLEVGGLTVRSELAVPLRRAGQVSAVLYLGSELPGGVGAEDARMVEMLAGPLAAALEGARLYAWARKEIDERKQAEQELRQAKEVAEAVCHERLSFVASLNHQLRTPLSAIIGYSEILREQFQDEGNAGLVRDAERIRSAGVRLLEMIQDVVDLAKIETGRLALGLDDVAVAALVEEVVTDLRPLIEKNGNVLEVRCPADLRMCADWTKLRRILFALLSNAAKFTSQGTITFSVFPEKAADGTDQVLFQVSDTGAGMTAEELQFLAQPFTRVYGARLRGDGSIGLGLAVSQAFCQMMGGEISFSSEPAKGSTVVLRLPAVVDALPPGPRLQV